MGFIHEAERKKACQVTRGKVGLWGPGPAAAETAFYSNAHGPSSRQPRPNASLLEPNVMGPFREPRGMEPMPKPKCRSLIVYATENIHRILKYFSVEKLVRHLFLSIHSKKL